MAATKWLSTELTSAQWAVYCNFQIEVRGENPNLSKNKALNLDCKRSKAILCFPQSVMGLTKKSNFQFLRSSPFIQSED